KVSQAVEIAQDTMKIAKQSVLIGIFICVLLMLIASTGIIPALFFIYILSIKYTFILSIIIFIFYSLYNSYKKYIQTIRLFLLNYFNFLESIIFCTIYLP
ncbi:hypothetical protein EGW77_15645, partial [Enterococcus faecalis]